MPKWLRMTMYAVAGAIGLGGALLGFNKPVTMLFALAVMFAVEGVNCLTRRGERR